MTADQIPLILQTIGLLLFYAIIGLAPGIAIGLMIGNQLGARGKETLMRKHEVNLEKASEHNAQWDPTHQRWQ